ncbi:MAG: sulfotransferase domain-containing protein [Microcoleaceae cyanobacterium]
MLVVLNGAPKGGSTWLVQIVNAMKVFDKIPQEFQDPKWSNPSIAIEKLNEILNSCDLKSNQFYCKQHWYGEQQFKELLKNPQLKMVNIIRDIRDVLVSRYFHDIRIGQTAENDIDQYYWNKGRTNMKQYMDYHIFWHDQDTCEVQPFLCSYERLHDDFNSQVSELVNYLELASIIKDNDMNRIREDTSFSEKKLTGEGQFFRKGIVGDWQNHLSDAVVDDLKSLAVDTGYLKVKKKMFENFNLEILKKTDFGIQN